MIPTHLQTNCSAVQVEQWRVATENVFLKGLLPDKHGWGPLKDPNGRLDPEYMESSTSGIHVSFSFLHVATRSSLMNSILPFKELIWFMLEIMFLFQLE